MNRAALLVLVLAASPLAAQQAAPPAGDLAVPAARAMWQQMSGYLAAAAEEMPEADYGYRPTPGVRSFGELLAHVAGAQYMICAAALGDPPRAEDEVERSRPTRAALIAALRASTEYCARAYQITDAQAAGSITLFGSSTTRLGALMLNATHDAEHYGNIVTYMRMKGMVPPSSRPRS